eukprot:5328351-Prymnesium_polylepis.1
MTVSVHETPHKKRKANARAAPRAGEPHQPKRDCFGYALVLLMSRSPEQGVSLAGLGARTARARRTGSSLAAFGSACRARL